MSKRKAEITFASTCEVHGLLSKGAYGYILDIKHNEENRVLKYFEFTADDEIDYFYRNILRELYFGKFLLRERYLGYSLQEHHGNTIGAIVQKKAICSVNYLFPLPVHEIQRLFLPVMREVARLHRHGIVHRDIKPQNVLLDDTNELYLIDTSLAVRSAGAEEPNVVTLWYRAPEVCAGQPYNSKIDVWSLGIVLLEAYTGKAWTSIRDENLMLPFIQQEAVPGKQWASDAGLQNLLAGMLAYDPENRFSMHDVLHDSFWQMTSISSSSATMSPLPPQTVFNNASLSYLQLQPVRELITLPEDDVKMTTRIQAFDMMFIYAYDVKLKFSVPMTAFFFWDVARDPAYKQPLLAAACMFVACSLEQDQLPTMQNLMEYFCGPRTRTTVQELKEYICHVVSATNCTLFSAHLLQSLITKEDYLWMFATDATIWKNRISLTIQEVDSDGPLKTRLAELKKNEAYKNAFLNQCDDKGIPISHHFLNK